MCVCGGGGNKDKAGLRGLTAPLSTGASEFTKCLKASEEFKIYRV